MSNVILWVLFVSKSITKLTIFKAMTKAKLKKNKEKIAINNIILYVFIPNEIFSSKLSNLM